ncbi:MAG: ATP-dependent Clp protease ATP-binding subunit [Candidatus Aminicenantes bacterium]|nr:ATP-dependent Clp protease ATP-binding subunit [Candidatus Aminicenantes bacterium]
MERITPAVFIAWQLGGLEARNILRREKIEKEHIFLGLLKLLDLTHDELVGKMGVPPDVAPAALEEVRVLRPIFEKAGADVSNLRWLLRSSLPMGPQTVRGEVLHRSDACRAMFEDADRLRSLFGHPDLNLTHLLTALLGEETSTVVDFLAGQKVNVNALRAGFQDALEKTPRPAPASFEAPGGSAQAQPGTSIVSKIGRDLTELARANKLGPVIGRDPEIKSVAQALTRKKKNSAILLGDPGVGKTAVVEGLAQKLVREELTGEELKGVRIVEIRMGDIVAGTKFRGDLEEKLSALLKEAERDRKLVIFLDEIHTIMQAGGGSGSVGVADILKPAIQSGDFRCIGATTFKEYKKYIESDPALERRFQPVVVKEPTREETLTILSGLKASYEKHHGLRISDEAVEAAVEMSIRYLPDAFLPDKALDLVDEAAAMLRIHSVDSRREEAASLEKPHIAEAVSKRKGIPLRVLLSSDAERVRNLRGKLAARIIGQTAAVDMVAAAITEVKALGPEKNKPSGLFLFAGATGVGKTEMAKALADILFEGAEGKLLAFDMSEYMEEHSVSKLIGAPPGYIGFEAGGQLVEQVRRYPYSVVLFDEIEKAHPKVFDVFLQIFDEARLTDSSGRRADFQNAFVILTSNVGGRVRPEASGRPIGIQVAEASAAGPASGEPIDLEAFRKNVEAALMSKFRPEFLGRLPHKIVFFPLDPAGLKAVLTTILLPRIERRLAAKKTRLAVDEAVLDRLVARCDIAYGVRSLIQILDNEITKPLTEGFVAQAFGEGDVISVRADGDKLAFSKA